MKRLLRRTIPFSMGLLAVNTGCAGFIDTVTSQRFQEAPITTVFSNDDPMEILVKDDTHRDRAWALANVREAKDPGQQEQLMQIMRHSATVDSRAMCRISAIKRLSEFKDPRAHDVLIAAYRQVDEDQKSAIQRTGGLAATANVTVFTPDIVTNIKTEVINALANNRRSDGLKLLCEVASTPTQTKAKPTNTEDVLAVSFLASSNETDVMDIKLAAIRALGKYTGDMTAIRTLVGVLQNDRQVAVQVRAHEALVTISGHDLPPDGKAWSDWLSQGGQPKKPSIFSGIIP